MSTYVNTVKIMMSELIITSSAYIINGDSPMTSVANAVAMTTLAGHTLQLLIFYMLCLDARARVGIEPSGNRSWSRSRGPHPEASEPSARPRCETRLSDGAPDPKLSLPAPPTPPQRTQRAEGGCLRGPSDRAPATPSQSTQQN